MAAVTIGSKDQSFSPTNAQLLYVQPSQTSIEIDTYPLIHLRLQRDIRLHRTYTRYHLLPRHQGPRAVAECLRRSQCLVRKSYLLEKAQLI